MQLTPREFEKLLIYMMANVALQRKAKGLKLNYPEAVAIISATALDGARAGKTIEEVTKDAGAALTKADVMDGVADLVPMIWIEVVFTDSSRPVTVHTPIQPGGRLGVQLGSDHLRYRPPRHNPQGTQFGRPADTKWDRTSIFLRSIRHWNSIAPQRSACTSISHHPPS